VTAHTRRLTDEEQALLRDAVAGGDPELERVVSDLIRGEILGEADANALRDAIGDELARTGVDQEVGAVNERGRRLDALIDRVAAQSVLHDA
jgi:hypothetical protein